MERDDVLRFMLWAGVIIAASLIEYIIWGGEHDSTDGKRDSGYSGDNLSEGRQDDPRG